MSARQFLFCLLLTLLISMPSMVKAQVKIEKEERVSPEQVPAMAIDSLRPWITSDSSVKWYRESGNDGRSYEAKFNSLRYRWSIEFDEEGALEDIEVQLKWQKMSAEQRSGLCTGFSQISGFKLRRIQGQWLDWPRQVARLRDRLISTGPSYYEVEYISTESGRKLLYEGLFSPSGELLKSRQIIVGSTDNLDLQ